VHVPLVHHGPHKPREPVIEVLAVQSLADGGPSVRELSALVQMPEMPRAGGLQGRRGGPARFCSGAASRANDTALIAI
jgi:hypothetical protein